MQKVSIAWRPDYAARMHGMQASEIRELLKIAERADVISFAGGIPDPSLFPTDRVREACDRILSDPASADRALQYSVSEGDPDLRDWIAEHMRGKGVPCDRDNILITSGSQQALEFIGRMFINPGDRAIVQAPTYLGALQAFAPNQPIYGHLSTTPNGEVAVDAPDLPAADRRDAFIYVVPDFANPTGETLGEQARRGLLDLAGRLGIPVIEDSPYDALRFEGLAPPPIQAIDAAAVGLEASRVIHCGSFSKVLTPGLRVGWVCASREIIGRMTLVKQSSDLNSPALNQRVALELATSVFSDQVELARARYREKRDAMLAGIAKALPPGSRWSVPEGGMFLWVELPERFDAASLLPSAVEQGVAFVPGAPFYAKDRRSNTLRLSYSLPSLDRIEDGLHRLTRCLDRRC